MVNITLEFQPFPFLKYTRKINGTFPSTFEELKPAQLIAITKFINLKISETIFLESITSIKKFRINRLDDYHRYQLLQLFEPFTSVTPYDSFIIQNIKTQGKLLVSPKPKLVGMTIGQFMFVESYFSNYQDDKNPSDLYKFIAALYLPEYKSFDENQITSGILVAEKIKPEILDAIVINYVLVKEWLAMAYPLVFQSDIETDESYGKQPKTHKKPGNSGWLKIFESIVGDDLVNHDRYAILPLHNVLRWMTNKIKAHSPLRLPQGGE